MEKDPSIENLPKVEQAIVDLLTFHYVKGFKFEFPLNSPPLLTDVYGQPLMQCKSITEINDDFARLDTPLNVSEFKYQNLGALYYLLTGIKLAERKRELYSDNYTHPGGLSKEGKTLWQQLFALGLAEKFDQIKYFHLRLPDPEIITGLHEIAKQRAHEIYASGAIESAIQEITERLRHPAAGQILE